MKCFLAIVQQTMRSAIRAKIFHVLFALILLAVFLLPLTVSGDGTANGLVQISITYSLGVVVALISTTTLWLSCSQLSREIEAYNIHLVVAKPIPRWKLWLGKWTGIFIMHAVILCASAALVFALIQIRVKVETSRGRFTEAEIAKLDKETRVGRRAFYPDRTDFGDAVKAEFAKRKARGEVTSGNEASTMAEIRRQLIAKDGEVAPDTAKTWHFKGVSGRGDILYLRYRIYSGDTNAMSQQTMPCVWGVRAPDAPKEIEDPYQYLVSEVMGGTFQETYLTKNCIDKSNGNSVSIRFANPPQGHELWRGAKAASAMFQAKDGPVIMVEVASFGENFIRAMILALFQIAFLAALGCTVSAAFSTPVAAFVAVTYLIIGLMVQPAINAPLKNDDGSYQYKNVVERAAHYLAIGVGDIVVSVDDLDATSSLARGRLIENSRIVTSFLTLLILKTGLMSAIGIWILNKRELGTVIRK